MKLGRASDDDDDYVIKRSGNDEVKGSRDSADAGRSVSRRKSAGSAGGRRDNADQKPGRGSQPTNGDGNGGERSVIAKKSLPTTTTTLTTAEKTKATTTTTTEKKTSAKSFKDSKRAAEDSINGEKKIQVRPTSSRDDLINKSANSKITNGKIDNSIRDRNNSIRDAIRRQR